MTWILIQKAARSPLSSGGNSGSGFIDASGHTSFIDASGHTLFIDASGVIG